jgi:hypothetical protein
VEIKQMGFCCAVCGGKVLFDGEHYFCENDSCGMVIPAWAKEYADCDPVFENEDDCIKSFFSNSVSYLFFGFVRDVFQSFLFKLNRKRNIVEREIFIEDTVTYEDVRKPVL